MKNGLKLNDYCGQGPVMPSPARVYGNMTQTLENRPKGVVDLKTTSPRNSKGVRKS